MTKSISGSAGERVHITYKSGAGGQETELPLKILVIGDFTGRAGVPLETREPVRVEQTTLAQVMAEHKISVRLTVSDRLASEPEGERTVDLSFNSIHDFEPDAVAGRVPELAALVDLRSGLDELKHALAAAPGLERRLREILGSEALTAQLRGELGLE